MSHTSKVTTKFRSPDILERACKKLGFTFHATGAVTLFDGTKYNGAHVVIPKWHYPVAVNFQTGVLSFDNYNGRWGSQNDIDRLIQQYATSAVVQELEQQGLEHTLSQNQNGDTVIHVSVGASGDAQAGAITF